MIVLRAPYFILIRVYFEYVGPSYVQVRVPAQETFRVRFFMKASMVVRLKIQGWV